MMTDRLGKKPLRIIKTSSNGENDVLINVDSPTIQPKRCRAVSLPDCRRIYKDLTGFVHQEKTIQREFRSCPSMFLIRDDQRQTTSSLRSPADSSSRCSLYGSFFNLSECEFVLDERKTSFDDKCRNWLNELEPIAQHAMEPKRKSSTN